MKVSARCLIVCTAGLFVSSCAYTGGYNPTYLPDEQPEYLSGDEVLLVMPEEEEDYVFSGNPSSFTGAASKLTIPIGMVLKEVSEEILEDRFSGGTDFANDFLNNQGYKIALNPSLKRFDYRYNQLKNIGFAITPEIEVDLQVAIMDEDGKTIFNQLYESGVVSGGTYVLSGSPGEKVNQLLHQALYDLLEQSFVDARPVVIERLEQ